MLTKETMADTFKKLKNKRSAAGIDGQTYAEFESGLAENCEKLESVLKAKRYRAPKIRRVHIPKPNGKTRPLGITTIGDKVVPAPAAAILSAVYSSEFKECNFGYRTRKGAHQALDYMQQKLAQCIGWVVEMDIEAFFDNINHDWLMKMLKLKIDDEVFLRLIGKWLKAKEALRHFIHENKNMRIRNILQKVSAKLSGFYAYFGTRGTSKALYAMDREAEQLSFMYTLF